MAILSAVNFKAAIATAAAAITTAWKDSSLTEVAGVISHPLHPLRNLKKLFLFNADTGAVTTNTAYIDACYAGNMPAMPSGYGKISNVDLTLVSITVTDASEDEINLTFNQNIIGMTGISVAGTITGAAKTIDEVRIYTGNVVNIKVNTAYINGDAPVVTGFFEGVNRAQLQLTDEAVTNTIT